MEPTVDDLIAQMEQARQRLNAAIQKVTPQVDIYPDWKLKQLLDHITGWDELMVPTFQAYARGEPPPIKVKHGINQFNAESVQARKEMSLDSSQEAFMLTREKVIQAMHEIPAERLAQKFPAPWGGNCTIASVVKIFVSHELEHAKHIEEALAGSAGSI